MTIILIPFLALISAVHAEPPVIYGEDNRVETVESKSALFKQLAASTAVQMSKDFTGPMGGKILFEGQTLSDFVSMKYGSQLCEGERFKEQVALGNCSGFLVAPDVILTAGHCFSSKECETYDWVFNYKAAKIGDNTVTVSERNVYHCKEIIAFQNPNLHATRKDFAVIKLDRPVAGVAPLKVAARTPGLGTSLVLIGHPSGLPQKIADGASVKRIIPTGFFANVDAFGGNSGSAVFNDRTGEVVGILVNGADDYTLDSENACMRVAKLSQDKGEEGVSGVEQFLQYLK